MLARLSTVHLLVRHILRTMSAHMLRTAIVWAALAAALAVVIGIFSFTTSIDDSYRARGDAVRGVADLQVRAVANSTFSNDLVGKLEDVRGTRHVVPVDEQRIAINSKKTVATVASAFGIDNSAKKLRSDLQRELNVRTPKNPEDGGLTISREMARTLDVKRGDKVRILAFSRSPKIKIRRVQSVRPSLSEVVALPRKSLEHLRGRKGPNTLFVQLKPGTSVAQWKRRAKDELPGNAEIVTAADQQHQLDEVLSVTTRSYTYLFGAVALLIVALLVYVLQLMRMIDRQEDAGLVRALGSSSAPLAVAELVTLTFLLLLALPVGVIGGGAFAHQLASNLPNYLTQVFSFTMVVEVHASVVAMALISTLVVAAIATLGALLAARAPVADQLGRSPQSGATAVAPISLRAATVLTLAGFALLGLAALMTGGEQFILTAIFVMLGIGVVTPGIAALLAHALVRFERGGAALMVARSAVESNPRRVAISAAIMALAVSAVVPLQLLDHAIGERTKELTGIHQPKVQRIAASSDLFTTVPVRLDYLRRGLKEKDSKPKVKPVAVTPGMTPADVARAQRKAVAEAREDWANRPLPEYADPFSMGFATYRGQRIGVMGLDSRRTFPFKRQKNDEANHDSAGLLRAHRDQAVISQELASWTDLKVGDKIRLRTPEGMRSTKISSVVDDMSWPMGTVYFDIKRHRELFGRDAVNALIVKPGKVDRAALKDLRPLHTYSGADLARRITGQINKTRSNMLAMRWMIVLAAMVALTGILATAVLARRREWAVLRAVGISRGRLLFALAIEIAVILVIGAVIGAIGGVISYEGPILAFLENQGFPLGREIVAGPLLVTAVSAIGVGLIAVMLSALLVVRAKLTDALSYE
jgi:putative ABC transport system permease protein